jgi:energy-coupling factor transport system permease protein
VASVDYVPVESPIHRLNAKVKLAILLCVFILVLLFSDPLYIIPISAVILALWFMSNLPARLLYQFMRYFLIAGVFMFIIQALFYPGEHSVFRISGPIPWLGFSGYVSLEGIKVGIAILLRLFSIIILAPMIVMTTPIPDILVNLNDLKVPYSLSFILTTAMSLMPTIEDEAFTIREAQIARGSQVFEKGKFFEKLKAFAALMIPLAISTFRDSQMLSIAINSRGFGAPVKRTFLRESRLRPVDYGILVVTFIALGVGLYLRIKGYGML